MNFLTKRFLALFCILIAGFSLSLGQNTNTSLRPLAWVTVKRPYGGFIDSLTVKDIEVQIGKIRLDQISFEQKLLPTTVGLVIDLSSPVKSDQVDRSQRVLLAAYGFQRFLKASDAGIEYFISTFDKEYKTLLTPTSDVTQVSKTLNSLEKIERGGSQSAAKDALQLSFSNMVGRQSTKKVLIFISEGADVESSEIKNVNLSKMKDIAKQSDTILYFIYVLTNDDFSYSPPIGVVDVRPMERKPKQLVRELMLKQPMELRTHSLMRFQHPSLPYPLTLAAEYEYLAVITGGRMFYPYGQNEVSLTLEIIANELKHQYLLSGEIEALGTPDKFQQLKLKVRNSSQVIVRTREGFYLN